jgi:undecaprenyl phosphate N,N'-diacetylbacillosamine 1-phosphate transferase
VEISDQGAGTEIMTTPYRFGKKILDFCGALVLLMALLPLLLLIALLIRATSPGPVFFRQRRLGYRGRYFSMIKFRTMVDGAVSLGSGIRTAENDVRITAVGGVLRRFSLDELPQLINILRGDMSFIGPRPVPEILVDQYDFLNPRRLALRPGITGWAQVSGRNELDWPQKIQKDIEYADNISFLLDLRILVKTVSYVFAGGNIYSRKYAAEVEESNRTLRGRLDSGRRRPPGSET